MAKNNTPEVKEQQKVQTKYDRKMEARKRQKIKEQREEKITRTIAAAAGVVLVAAIIVSIAVSIINKNNALNGTYIKVGEHELTQVEYDYYYQTTVNSYLNNYSYLLPYIGLDTSVDFDKQTYYMDNTMTWKDMFDQMTVEQIKQYKALVDDAQKEGFTYDTEEEYTEFVSGAESAASEAGMSVSNYYKQAFGRYATKANLENYVKESFFANAYYDSLLETNVPTDEEIKAYYEENKQNYDKVDYRSFTFNADLSEDATEEEVSTAMDELEEKADAMLQARQEGSDFETLCLENASEDNKANYEDAETEYSLSEGLYYTGINGTMAEWLFEDGRAEGDIVVLRNDSAKACYVVEFISRYYDEADDENIANTIALQRTSEYISALTENNEVVDVKGELNLTAGNGEAAADNADTGTDAEGEAEKTEDAGGDLAE